MGLTARGGSSPLFGTCRIRGCVARRSPLSFRHGELGEDLAKSDGSCRVRVALRRGASMTSLPHRNGSDKLTFCYRDKRHYFKLGKISDQEAVSVKLGLVRFARRYLETYGNGSFDASSLKTAKVQLGHFERTLGGPFPVQSLTLADLRRHVEDRSRQKYRGRPGRLELGIPHGHGQRAVPESRPRLPEGRREAAVNHPGED